MSKYKIIIRDTVELMPAYITDKNKSVLKDFDRNSQSIIIKVAASHAGRVTKNNGFYLPDKMQTGVETFTKDFNKPVLTHHESDKDPIGRILSARYIDTSDKTKLLNSFNPQLLMINDRNIPFIQKVFAIRNYINQPLLDDVNYEGLGFAEVTARISDSKAVERIKDGRYLTVSIGASSDRAVCNVCSQDWSEEGRCDHKPGRYYSKDEDGSWVEDKTKSKNTEKTKCFLVYGDLFYDEFSFINKPADTIAKVLEIHADNGVIDSIESNQVFEKVLTDYFLTNEDKQTMFSLSDSTQTNLLNSKNKEELNVMSEKIKKQEQPKGAQDSDSKTDDLSSKLLDGTLKLETPNELAMATQWHDNLHHRYDPFDDDSDFSKRQRKRMAETDLKLHAKLHKMANDEGFRADFINGPLDETLEQFGVKDSVELPKGAKEKSKEIIDDSDKDKGVKPERETSVEEPKDSEKGKSQDSTEFNFEDLDLEKLNDKDFAEINRDLIYDAMIECMEEAAKQGATWHKRNGDEFTVEDAKLSTAKRKRLSSSTFCGPGRSFPVPDCAHVTAARRLIGKAKVGSSTKATILSCVNRKARAMGCDSVKSRDAYSEEKIDSLSNKQLEQLYRKIDEELVKRELCPLAPEIEENEQLKNEVEDLDGRVDALKKELELAWQDCEGAQSNLAEVLKERHQDKASLLIDMKLLSGANIEDYEKALEEETQKSSDVLDTLIKENRKKLDLSKISDKLNDGTVRVPKGTVDDPTTNKEDLVKDSDSSEADKKQRMIDAKEVYYRFRAIEMQDLGQANAFLSEMEAKGFIDSDLFNKFTEELK